MSPLKQMVDRKALYSEKDKLHILRNKGNTCYCERCTGSQDSTLFFDVKQADKLQRTVSSQKDQLQKNQRRCHKNLRSCCCI
jgi:hypothetical protein